MCRLMTEALLAWRDDPAVELVLLDHSGERGFCAGGDIRMLAESGAGDGAAAREFFFTEYRLNHLLFSYPKPRRRDHGRRSPWAAAWASRGPAGSGWRPSGPPSPCRRPGSACSRTSAAAGTCRGCPTTSGLWLALTGARIKAADCELVRRRHRLCRERRRRRAEGRDRRRPGRDRDPAHRVRGRRRPPAARRAPGRDRPALRRRQRRGDRRGAGGRRTATGRASSSRCWRPSRRRP